MLASIQEATRILQTSGPAEATAAIQRALQETEPSLEDDVKVHAPEAEARTEQVLPELPFRTVVPGTVVLPAARPAHGPRIEVPPGEFLTGEFSNRAGAREYKLYVPSGHHAQALPLVVMLHGCTQTPDDFASGTRMNAAAELQPCFVLYPAQTQRANGSRCWNWFKSGHQRRDRGEPAIIGGMTREIIARYGIDPRRVYVAGLSAGGAMAAIMKSTHPDLFAAVGVHSGLPYGAAHDLPTALEAMKGRPRSPARPDDLTPLIVFHGDRDKTVHPRNGDEILAQGVPRSGAPATSSSTEVQEGRVPDGHPFTRTLYRGRAGRVIAEHWVVHGAAHAWSGGSDEGSYVDPRGPDATREMLRFFSLWAQPEA
jgi:poly(hydroxyalkanoate) depolymerase family esterase